MVGANLEGLVSPHDETGPAILLVLEETNVTSATLLPLLRLAVELEELGAPTDKGSLAKPSPRVDGTHTS